MVVKISGFGALSSPYLRNTPTIPAASQQRAAEPESFRPSPFQPPKTSRTSAKEDFAAQFKKSRDDKQPPLEIYGKRGIRQSPEQDRPKDRRAPTSVEETKQDGGPVTIPVLTVPETIPDGGPVTLPTLTVGDTKIDGGPETLPTLPAVETKPDGGPESSPRLAIVETKLDGGPAATPADPTGEYVAKLPIDSNEKEISFAGTFSVNSTTV